MQMRILSAGEVDQALPMERAIEVMRYAFGQLAAGNVDMPLRVPLNTEQGVTLCMPAYLPQRGNVGVKLVSVYDANPDRGLPRIHAVVLLFDPETGVPVALMDGTRLTGIRTGAGGGLAADLLARQDAQAVTLFGAGIQARAQLRALMCVRPIRQVSLISRTEASAARFAREIASWTDAPEVQIVREIRPAIEESDIVVTATTSGTPLFDGNWIPPGCHLTAVGAYTPEARELDSAAVLRARVVVDSREAALEEAGDILLAGAAIDAELGEIVNGVKPGRQTAREITLFKSVGLAVQDAAAAGEVLRQAEVLELGTTVDL